MKKLVPITEVKNNKENPRVIKDHKFKLLVESLKEFPQMLKLRPIVVDKDNVVLGGNMRLKASKEAGLKKVWIDYDETLTPEQEKEFIIKDNSSFGEWDWKELSDWNTEELTKWGLDVPKWERDVEFISDSEDSIDYDYTDEAPQTNVKMLQLFLTTDTDVIFRKWELALREHFNSDNLTDTIYRIVEETHKKIIFGKKNKNKT